MGIIIVDEKDLDNKLDSKLDFVKAEIIRYISSISNNRKSDWIKADEAIALLNLKSIRCLKPYRDNHKLVFSKTGKTFCYSYKSVMEYLDVKSNKKFLVKLRG